MSTVTAEDDEAVRPNINLFHRWVEDWSALADSHMRVEPLDSLTYIPLPFDDPKSYVSLGLTVRERFELNAWLEGQRTAIERALPRLTLPQRAGVTSS